MSPESKKLFNIVILGVAFMFMFTAFQTCGNVAISMFVSGLFYSMYIAVFIQPFPWSFYTASVFIGIAAAVLWTAQGNCLTINSDEHTIGRNSGIFWALLQSSLFFGNLYIYFAWQGKTQISEHDRRTVFIALTVISLVGTVLFFLIRKPDPENVLGEEESCDDQDMEATESAQNNVTKAVDAFKKSLRLCVTREMLLLSVTTAYTGGSLFGLLSKNSRFGRNPVVLLGTLVHFVAFYLIFLNMPGDAPIAPVEGTNSIAYIRPSKEVAILCSFLLGLGDSCFNTQLLSILGFLYSEDSAPAFAVFKFVQSICAAVAFFYSNYLLLHWQLLVMVIFGFFGTISFFAVEWDAAAIVARGSDYRSI